MLMNCPLFEEELTECRLDDFVGTTAESVTWLSGYWAMPRWIRRGAQAYAFQPLQAASESFIVTGTVTGLLDHAADLDLYVSNVHRYGFFGYEDLIKGVGEEAARLRKMLDSPEHESPAHRLTKPCCELGFGGFQVEDMVTVTATGVKSFMTRLRDLVRCR